MSLAIITASTDPNRAKSCLSSWMQPNDGVSLIVVVNGLTDFEPQQARGLDIDAHWIVSHQYLGTVPAFRVGVDYALSETTADIICCLHDDVELLESDWAHRTIRLFQRHPSCGLAGFGGAIGLGADDLYKAPYNPMQLARIGFRSNLVDAEVHGVRSLLSERVACLDGFSQIGRRAFFEGQSNPYMATRQILYGRPWTYLEEHGIVHHLYDGLLGAHAARLGWECWYIPVRCRHYGGQTAVGDTGYQAWAQGKIPGGDHGFWQQSHKIGAELYADVLPLRI